MRTFNNSRHNNGTTAAAAALRPWVPWLILACFLLFVMGGWWVLVSASGAPSSLSSSSSSTNARIQQQDEQHGNNNDEQRSKEESALQGGGGGTDESQHNNFYPTNFYERADHLIMVPCHGVFKGLNAPEQYLNPQHWALEAFQRPFGKAFVKSLVAHIERGVRALVDSGDRGILMFSGGETRSGAGPRSEAQGYFTVAAAANFFDLLKGSSSVDGAAINNNQSEKQKEDFKNFENDPNFRRVFTEEFARDSYENLIFSICRFYEITGRYPRRITVVGFEYKKERFVEAHRLAVRFPRSAFHYIGVDMDSEDVQVELNGRTLAPLSDRNSYLDAKIDPYLCSAHRKLRAQRNPLRRTVPYFSRAACPAVFPLLRFCGPKLYNPPQRRPLPWPVSPD